MSQQYPGAAGHPGTPPPGSQDQWEGQWEDEWDEDSGARPGSAPPAWPAPPGGPWPPPPPPPPGGQGGPRPSRIQSVTAGVIAVIAALVVAVVVLFATHGDPTAPAPAAGAGRAPVGGGQPVQGGGGFSGGGGGGAGGGNHLVMGGQVTKVSSTSITLGGQGHTITAAITGSTQFTGTVKSAGGIKPGQNVMVVISGYGSTHPVAQSISDPPSMP